MLKLYVTCGFDLKFPILVSKYLIYGCVSFCSYLSNKLNFIIILVFKAFFNHLHALPFPMLSCNPYPFQSMFNSVFSLFFCAPYIQIIIIELRLIRFRTIKLLVLIIIFLVKRIFRSFYINFSFNISIVMYINE